MKSNCKLQIKQNLIRLKKVIKRKTMIIPVRVGLIKKIQLHKMSYFPEPYTRNKNKIKVELDLSNYATKSA